MQRQINKITIGNKKYKIKEGKIYYHFEPAYYDSAKKTIYLANGLSDIEWLAAMIHEINEILLHEFFQPALEQIL